MSGMKGQNPRPLSSWGAQAPWQGRETFLLELPSLVSHHVPLMPTVNQAFSRLPWLPFVA